jgi:Flp pilus assembly protein TadD
MTFTARQITIFIVALAVSLAAAVLAVAGVQDHAIRKFFRDPDIEGPSRYIGSETCGACHPQTLEVWRTSHHAKAMMHATDKTVLGNFNNVTFDYFGVQSRMFRLGGRFMIETDGPDGAITPFEVKYTFGVEPLQQYLVEFADGRVQVLPLAWDSRTKERGGQKWFHLYPQEKIDHTDVLHWTKLNQNWNYMCAECHSTGVRKNYDPVRDAYRTTFAEISVGCEGCHGQGSRHAAWARSQKAWFHASKSNDPAFGLLLRYAERLNVIWTLNATTGNVRRSIEPAVLRTEVESCGMCHARRGQLSEDWIPGRSLSHTHSVSLLSTGLYDAAGQMDDEVFNYGSFKQSSMFAKGVTCSDCHEPHSGKTRIAGDGVCLQCHAQEKFSAATHHRHEKASPPVTCAKCHMATRTYMLVDERHDHSFRVPRPDQSVTSGAPNACNDCHKDKPAQWAANFIDRWHGPHRKGVQTYTSAFAAARAQHPEAERLLVAIANDRLAPSIARATALSELASSATPEAVAAARTGLRNSDPMVRIAALEVLETAPLQQSWPIAAPLLYDAVRGVRIRAAMALASLPPTMQPANDRGAFERAAQEFVAAQKLNADRPEARTALGVFYLRQGRVEEAEAQYRSALRLSPQFAPALANLADLLRQANRDSDALAILRDGVWSAPTNPVLLHTLGLALVRAKGPPDETVHALRQATDLAPENARYGYVYGVALHSFGRKEEALKALRAVLSRHPAHRDTLETLITFEQEAGDLGAALAYADRLLAITPQDNQIRRIADELRRRIPP